MVNGKLPVAAMAIALLAGVWIALPGDGARAANSAAKEAWYKALDRCMGMKRSQRSVCEREAWQIYQVEAAREQRKDVTIRLNYNTQNDTPAHAAAETAWKDAIDRCDDLKGDENLACMNEAWSAYQATLSQ